jgi:hypothetical protein
MIVSISRKQPCQLEILPFQNSLITVVQTEEKLFHITDTQEH